MSGPTGILLVDKTSGPTSHDMVARVRRLAGTRKVGHAGTLDPLATGLLVLGLGSSTRLLTYLVGLDKEYVATMRFGVATDSDDADGTVTAEADASGLSDEQIAAALTAQTGELDQVPSTVSAIKVNGRRAYDLARSGEEVALAPRHVTVSELEVGRLRREGDVVDVDARIACSSGTYIRAIARDAGAALGVGAHLTALRRTRVGPLQVTKAVELDDDTDVGSRLLAPAEVARMLFPVRELDDRESLELSQGKRIPRRDAPAGRPIAAIRDATLVGIVEVRGDELRPLVNFPTHEVGG
jgi:tRNA pseudouridine55 synthase